MEEKKAVRKLAESEFVSTEYKQPMFSVTAPIGTTRKDVMEPAFWTHVAKRMVPLSEIRISAQDGSWYGVYLVTYADTMQANLHELLYTDIDVSLPVDDGGTFDVQWAGPSAKFRVYRKSDKMVLQDGFASKDLAIQWMAANTKVAA